MPSLSSRMILMIASVSNGFLSTGSMFSLCCSADALDVFEHGGAAALISWTAPRNPACAERDHRARWRRPNSSETL